MLSATSFEISILDILLVLKNIKCVQLELCRNISKSNPKHITILSHTASKLGLGFQQWSEGVRLLCVIGNQGLFI